MHKQRQIVNEFDDQLITMLLLLRQKKEAVNINIAGIQMTNCKFSMQMQIRPIIHASLAGIQMS